MRWNGFRADRCEIPSPACEVAALVAKYNRTARGRMIEVISWRRALSTPIVALNFSLKPLAGRCNLAEY